MGLSYLFGGVGLVSAFACGLTLTNSFLRKAQSLTKIDARSNAQYSGWLAWYLRNGVSFFSFFAHLLLRQKSIRTATEEAVRISVLRGYVTSVEPLLSVFLCALTVFACFAGLLAGSLLAVVAVMAGLCAIVMVWLKTSQDKRRDALQEAVPDALQSMGVCFHTGLSLMQTFQQIAQETRGPLQTLFKQCARRMEIGGTVQEALQSLKEGTSVSELRFVAVALDVQHQSGGSMKQVLDAARDTVESEVSLKRSLRVQTAQAKLSARVVSIMPFLLIALFSLISEGFLDPFFSSVAGIGLLCLALGMQLIGILMVRRMLAVEMS